MNYKIELSEENLKNLVVFLERTDLKGKEMGAFVEIIQKLNKAEKIEEEDNIKS